MKVWAVAAALIAAGIATWALVPGGLAERAGLVAPSAAIEVQAKGDKGVAQGTSGNTIKSDGGPAAGVPVKQAKGEAGIATNTTGSGIKTGGTAGTKGVPVKQVKGIAQGDSGNTIKSGDTKAGPVKGVAASSATPGG